MKTFKKKTEINLGDGEAGFISCPIPFTLQTLSAPTRQCLFIGARSCPRAGTVTNNSPRPPRDPVSMVCAVHKPPWGLSR